MAKYASLAWTLETVANHKDVPSRCCFGLHKKEGKCTKDHSTWKQVDLVLLLTLWKNQQGLAHLASHCALTVGLHAHAIAEIVTSQLDAELSLGSHFETNQTKNNKSL